MRKQASTWPGPHKVVALATAVLQQKGTNWDLLFGTDVQASGELPTVSQSRRKDGGKNEESHTDDLSCTSHVLFRRSRGPLVSEVDALSLTFSTLRCLILMHRVHFTRLVTFDSKLISDKLTFYLCSGKMPCWNSDFLLVCFLLNLSTLIPLTARVLRNKTDKVFSEPDVIWCVWVGQWQPLFSLLVVNSIFSSVTSASFYWIGGNRCYIGMWQQTRRGGEK